MDFNLPQPGPVVSSSGSIPNRPPGENDVIVGANCNKHGGNIKFQQFIKAYKRARYNQKIEPADAVKEVVEFWRRLSPRGRFLAQNKGSNHDGQWHEVDDRQAMRIASFFLLNQGSGETKRHELRRQKSIDAMRSRSTQNNGPPLMRSQSGPVSHVRRSMRGSGVGGVGGLDNPMQAKAQLEATGRMSHSHNPDMMSTLEPMPIGSTSSSSMGWGKGQVQQQRHSLQEPIRSSSSSQDLLDQSLEPFDFNPLPFNPSKEPADDFEPIQASLGSGGGRGFDIGKNNLDVSANAQFGGASDQVQVSVNMVVNTMQQGFQRDNSVNTVTNIQIGTGGVNDERKQPSKPPGNQQGQNFQLMTDTSNGFIQISAQSNAGGSDESSMMKSDPSQPSQQQTGNVQMGFLRNQERSAGFNNHNSNDLNVNGGGMMGRDQMMNTINGNMAGNTNRMNRNSNFGNGTMANGNMAANGNMMIANPGMSGNGNLMGGMPGQNMNMNVNVNMNTNNPVSSSSSNNNSNSNGGQNARWNKNEVANSVPCAASLVGSLFDDW